MMNTKYRSDEGPILIIAIPQNTEIGDGIDAAHAGLNLSSLLSIHKILTRFAIDWEIGTCEGEKAWINQDVTSEEAKEFFRNCFGKISSPANLEEIKGNEYRGLIIPSMTGLMGSFRSQPLTFRLSLIIKQLFLECKCVVFSGYGIIAGFECRDVNHNWIFNGFNLTSLSLIQQSSQDKFPQLPYLIEDRIRELGGNFCWNDSSSDLLVLDRKILTVQDDKFIQIACNTFGYLLNDFS